MFEHKYIPLELRIELNELHDKHQQHVSCIQFGLKDTPVLYPFWIHPEWKTLVIHTNTAGKFGQPDIRDYAPNVKEFNAYIDGDRAGKKMIVSKRSRSDTFNIYSIATACNKAEFPLKYVNLVVFDLTGLDYLPVVTFGAGSQDLYPDLIVIKHDPIKPGTMGSTSYLQLTGNINGMIDPKITPVWHETSEWTWIKP